MTLYYIGTGGAITSGCATTSYLVYNKYKWIVNSILYIKHKAAKGVLERIAIKRVILNRGPKTGGQLVPIYQDTLNSLWNEEDLILESEANELVQTYRQMVDADYAAAQCK